MAMAPPIALLDAPTVVIPSYNSSFTASNYSSLAIAVWFEGGSIIARGSSGSLAFTTNEGPTNMSYWLTFI